MTCHRRAVSLLAALLLAAPATAQQPAPPEPANLRGDSAQTRKRLAEAEQKVLGGKPIDAADDLQRLLDEAGDDLVTLDGKQFRTARWVAHQILAKLPPDALKAYQDRIDEPAAKLLAAGRRDRDPRPLWQLLDRYFVSRPAEEGLLLLGDLLFERAEFRTAEVVWRRLLPDASPDVAYPAPKTDPAAIRARIGLAALFQGDFGRVKAELATLREKHPNAAGPLAGKTGPYAATLQSLIDQPPMFTPEAAPVTAWPTFAGGPGRAGRFGGRFPPHWQTRPTWTEALRQDGSQRQPLGHPVIVGGRVYVSDGPRVFAFDLLTGRPPGGRDPRGYAVPLLDPVGTGHQPGATVTAADGRLYARVGPPAVRAPVPARAGMDAPEESAIVSLAPPARPREDGAPVEELWRLRPLTDGGKSPATWEGTPLVADRRMWAVLARFDGGRVAHAVVCYDPADADTAPERPAWIAEVSDSALASGSEARTRPELLTLAGRNVVFCSNAGVVVAVDARTGRRAWGFKYPRAARRLAPANRTPDPAPPVAFGGRVFVAPLDGERAYALDAETGQLLWESGPVEGAQLLGVSRDRLIVTTTGPVRGIRALDVRTGSHRRPDGWVQHDGGGLLAFGRGIVSDDVIAWPTEQGLFFLDPETGLPLARQSALQSMVPGRPQLNRFGNMAYADGVLVVVTPYAVWGYVSEGKWFGIGPRSARDPRRAGFDAAIDAAERQLADGDPAAHDTLLGVARGDLPPGFRAWAAGRLLLLTPPVDDPGKLPPALRSALDPALRDEWLVTPGGDLVTLDTLIARRTGREPTAGSRPATPTLPAARKPQDVPGLARDADVDHTLRLPPATVPLRPIVGAATPSRHLFAAAGPELLAIALETATKIAYLAPDSFTHAADLKAGFVAAGPQAVALYAARPEPEWVFRVPETDPLPDRPGRVNVRTEYVLPAPHLSSFVLAGSWLFARLGETHLVAFDLASRRVAWVLGAHGRPRFEPLGWPNTPRFEPHYLVTGRLLAVQLSDGRRWMVRADNGRVWDTEGGTFTGPVPPDFGSPTARVPWPHPPVEVEANRIAFSDGAGLVRFHSLSVGRTRGVYEADGGPSLSGDPPQVRTWGDAVFVCVRRNHGVDLDRIELTDGKSVWPRGPVFLDAGRVSLSAADADPHNLYLPVGNRLWALAREGGKAAWDAELPDTHGAGSWVVRAGRKVVIVYPDAAIPTEPVAAVRDRIADSFARRPLDLRGWRLPALASTLYDAWVDRTVPVLLFDPETGRLLKELSVPARGPVVTAYYEGDLAVVATGDRVVWLK